MPQLREGGRFLVQNELNGDPGKAQTLRDSIYRHIRYSLGRDTQGLGAKELLRPLSLAIRDLLVDGMVDTERRYAAALGVFGGRFGCGRFGCGRDSVMAMSR